MWVISSLAVKDLLDNYKVKPNSLERELRLAFTWAVEHTVPVRRVIRHVKQLGLMCI